MRIQFWKDAIQKIFDVGEEYNLNGCIIIIIVWKKLLIPLLWTQNRDPNVNHNLSNTDPKVVKG